MHHGYFMLAITCCIASTLMKELGITVLGVCVIYDILFVAQPRFGRLSLSLEKVCHCSYDVFYQFPMFDDHITALSAT